MDYVSTDFYVASSSRFIREVWTNGCRQTRKLTERAVSLESNFVAMQPGLRPILFVGGLALW